MRGVNYRHISPPNPPLPLLKSGQIGLFIEKDAQCSKTYEKNNLPIFSFLNMVDFIVKVLRNMTTISP